LQRATAAHHQLVEQVLQRAEATSTALLTAIEHVGGYVTVTYSLGEEVRYFVPDHALYERMLRRGQLPPRYTFAGCGPERTIHDWSGDELRGWLDQHPAPGMATT
jgi:hypothetical protein